ncbi:GNAT family N-acetyltransferase [Cryobacterium sp. CG_9.6]|uniref:GNAT family N-acetyltransferase n=1 Tax=Cryobacterium sp. CG_9.6 TaxID=2760710 RepID=UPI002474390E|nr:GNAT family N-acetyltransferase [Cryobacterium sp. CG_9.6]MDH6237147.1 GNAT superfamily N-acetyltransferase [Cryobacterium sp. CG_9.6]
MLAHTPLRIRPAGPLDFDSIESMENRADRRFIERLEPKGWEAAPTGASRASGQGYLLVGEVTSATLVGFVHVIEAAGHVHLEQLSVLPEYGCRGYGRALLDAAMNEARRRGYRLLTLRTYADIPWNAPFYTRAGFIEVDATTAFHSKLIESELRLGLTKYGRRIQMVAELN